MSWLRTRFGGALAGLVGFAGCGGDVVQRSTGKAEALNPPLTSDANTGTLLAVNNGAPTDAEIRDRPSTPAKKPSLAIFDYAQLRALERNGFDLATLAFGDRGPSTRPHDNRTLSHDPRYLSIVNILVTDLERVGRSDPAAGVGMRFAHRMFDARWLTGEKFRFELIAIVNRVDRRVFAEGTCGEVRFVYRLAYTTRVKGQAVSSRLPMTVNVVRSFPADDCAQWTTVLEELPRSELVARTTLESVEVNLQTVRWPSTVRPSMAGHAEYLLRVFTRGGEGEPFRASTLENTPDVDRLSRDGALLTELSAWLTSPEQVSAVALGTVRVPEKFLATASTSVAPHGLARRSNRPFTALLADVWKASPHVTRTLRRLDGMSCPGCHQSRSVAGFHVLGDEDPDKVWDRLTSPHSPHVSDDILRRGEYAAALLSGTVTDEHRPPAEHARDNGVWGSRCGLDTSPLAPFSDWTCGAGFECRAVDDPSVGECLSVALEDGDTCEPGVATWDAARRDNIRLGAVQDCGAHRVCERNSVGFPGGMCSGGCSEDGADRDVVCGAIAMLDPFNACIARGEIFSDCLAKTTRPGTLRRCTEDVHCRDDYVCAVTPGGEGGCIPPYFLFQLRVDGHQVQ